jgi:hypothetical protein
MKQLAKRREAQRVRRWALPGGAAAAGAASAVGASVPQPCTGQPRRLAGKVIHHLSASHSAARQTRPGAHAWHTKLQASCSQASDQDGCAAGSSSG